MSPRRRDTGTSGTNADEIAVVHSSGNVFEDLGLPDPEVRFAKAALSRVIEGIIKERGWTQRKAASVLGIATSDMSELIRGKLARFSLERLELVGRVKSRDVVQLSGLMMVAPGMDAEAG